MIKNATHLVELIAEQHLHMHSNDMSSLDAIFVPFRSRPDYISDLIEEYKWFQCPIYLMPSTGSDVPDLKCIDGLNLRILCFHNDLNYLHFFSNLQTSQHKYTVSYCAGWDLAQKRNYALLFARQHGYKQILLSDDDIRGVSLRSLLSGSRLLNSFKVAGCFVNDFPDTSVVGHLEAAAGQTIYPFLSGSFLFIRPFDVHGFFPLIYNEDWLFMLPHVLDKTICSFGVIKQLPYNPFADIQKAAFQEFGEIIAEGLYMLVASGEYERRFSKISWSTIIDCRKEALNHLDRLLESTEQRNMLAAVYKANECINPGDCIDFVRAWESDIKAWHIYLEAIQNESFAYFADS